MTAIEDETPTDRLLNALHKLTQPQKVANWQKGHEHEWEWVDEDGEIYSCTWCDLTSEGLPDSEQLKGELRKRTDLPLLDWLHDAVTSDTGGSGGGKLARERTPLDVGAFTLYEDIDGRVRSWMVDVGGNAGKGLTPTQVLAAWYVLWNARNPGDGLIGAFARILEGWVDQINDTLDPPKRIEITSPCPSCGEEWLNVGLKLADGSDDPDDTERVHVLNVVERERLEDCYALCSACERVWRGVGQMRDLRIAIDDRESEARHAVAGE